MNQIINIALNIAWFFAKFFYVVVWIYMTLTILFGGGIDIIQSNEENHMYIGFTGIIPNITRIFKLILKK